MERRLKPSHPDYAEIDELSWLICVAKNPQMFMNSEAVAVDPLIAATLIPTLEEKLAELLDGGIWRDFINQIGEQ
jgi:hypothetical protein